MAVKVASRPRAQALGSPAQTDIIASGEQSPRSRLPCPGPHRPPVSLARLGRASWRLWELPPLAGALCSALCEAQSLHSPLSSSQQPADVQVFGFIPPISREAGQSV